MNREIKKLLFDILNSILRIEEYITQPKKFEEYEKNTMLQQAVERNIEIIGEATNILLKKNPDFPITNARKIVNTRNRIIHGYDDIENAEIWSVVINHLPKLKEEIEALLNAK